MAAGDDAGRPISLGREREADGGYGRKKKGQSRYKKCTWLRYKKDIIFHIKNRFSDFIKLGSKKYIFAKCPPSKHKFPKKIKVMVMKPKFSSKLDYLYSKAIKAPF